MDFLVYPIHLITAHPFAYMVVVVVLPILFANFSKVPKQPWQKRLIVAMYIWLPFNFIFGHYINSKLIYLVGAVATAQVTGTYQTSTRYNNHDVVGYHLLMKTNDKQVIETSFEDDDFNVYPSHNSVSYPLPGDRFNVRYLKHFPGSFIIISNDDSPWALKLQCGKWQSRLNEARNKFNFDKGNPQFKAAYIQAINDYVNKRCYIDSLDLEEYKADIKSAESANP